MKKNEMITAIANQTGVTKRDVEAVMASFRDVLVEEAAKGGQITIRGLGTFTGKFRKARIARNPANGEPVSLPDRRVLTFKPTVNLMK
jgi:DNA-binding protein HU-beta